MLNLPEELFQRVALITRALDDNSPVALSSLNRRFRQVAIGTPTLWTNIHISYSPIRMDLHLTRSGTALLHINISYLNPRVITIRDAALNSARQIPLSHRFEIFFFPKLQPHFHRFGSIKMHSVDCRILYKMITELLAFPPRMPSLRSLDMGLVRHYSDNFLAALRDLTPYGGGPLPEELQLFPLHSLSLGKMRFRIWGPVITAFFSNSITSLELTNQVTMTIQELKSALKIMFNLETLTIHDPILSWDFPKPSLTEPVVLPSLRELSLLQLWSDDMEDVIALLDVGDSLVKLCLAAKAAERPIPPGDDRPLIKNHGKVLRSATARNPLLHTLDVTDLTAEAGDWVQTFHNSPVLVTLSISSSGLDERCLAPLILDADTSDEGICMHLRNIVFNNEFNLDSNAIRKIAESRRREGVKLRSLVLQDWINPLDEDDVRKIQSSVGEFEVGHFSPHEEVSV